MIRRIGVLGVGLLLLLASAGRGQEAAGPVSGADATIRQGPWTLFADTKGGLHLRRGTEVFLTDIGLSCGKSGHTTFDRFRDRKVEGLSFSGSVPTPPVAYTQRVVAKDGRIVFRITRRGSLQGGWESFSVWLPIGSFRGQRYRADGKAGTYPERFDEEHPYLVRGVKRLECCPGDPARNLIFECDREIAVSDERRFGGQTYRVSVSSDRTASESVVELALTLPDLPANHGTTVRSSRIGYPAKGEKSVVLEWSENAPRPPDEVTLRKVSGGVVRKGKFGQTIDVTFTQGRFAVFDFTDVRTPGDYRLVWSGGEVEFPIVEHAFEDRLWEPTLDSFLPFLMCHAKVDLGRGQPGHDACHMDDGIRVPANFPGVDRFRSYECKGSGFEAGERIPCATGGWHDAGDCDLNINAQAFAVWMLSLTHEEFGIDRDVSTLDLEKGTFRARRKDRKPDLLQQVAWGAKWLLSMLREDGRTFVGIVAQPDRRSLGGRPWSEATDNRPGTGDERHVYVDVHSELGLMQAIALAAASRVLPEIDRDLARECRKGAELALEFFEKHDEVYRETVYFYAHRKGRDGMVAAALAELWLTTGNSKYARRLSKMTKAIRDLKVAWPNATGTTMSTFWYAPPFLARILPKLPAGDLKEAVESVCRRAAETQAGFGTERPWPFRYWHFGKWGNTSGIVSRVFDAYWLSRVAPETLPVASTVPAMLWIYGLHPVNDRVFVSGLGPGSAAHLHSGQIRAHFGHEPGTVPGALVPGLNGVFDYVSPNVLRDRDDGNCHNNEATVYGSVLYLFAVNALAKSGF